MFTDVAEVIKIISFETELKDEGIAKRVGYSRSHFNTLKKKADQSLIPTLLKEFDKEIKQFVRRYSIDSNLKTSDPQDQSVLEEILTYQKATLQAIQKMESKIDNGRFLGKDRSLDAEMKKVVKKGRQAGKGKHNNNG